MHSFALDSEKRFVKRNAEGRITLSQFGGNRISLLDPTSGDLKELARRAPPAAGPTALPWIPAA